MLVDLKIRRHTYAEWLTQPPLRVGEPGYDTTNDILKIGDGFSGWLNLNTNLDARGPIPTFGQLARPVSRSIYPPANFQSGTTPAVLTSFPSTTGMTPFIYSYDPSAFHVSGTPLDFGAGYTYAQVGGYQSNGYVSWTTNVAAQRTVLSLYALDPCSFQVLIDNQPLWSAPQAVSAGAVIVDLAWAARDNREVRILCQGSTMLFGAFYLAYSDNVYTPRRRFRLGIYGDSYLSSTFNSIGLESLPYFVALESGFDVYCMDQGGTGYCNISGLPVGGRLLYGDPAREAYVGTYELDGLLVDGSINDAPSVLGGTDASAAQAAATQFYKDIRDIRPKAPVVALGGPQPVINAGSTLPAAYTPLNNAIKAAAAAAPNVTKFIDWFGGDWLTGNGSDTAPNNSGNQDIYIGADGVHPNKAGARYLGRRTWNELASAPLAK